MGVFDYSLLKVLVIEDQAFVRQMISHYLKNLGCTMIMEAPDGYAGLKQVVENQPNFIICDINMEGMDGFGFLEKLKELDGKASDIPVVFLTSDGTIDSVKKAADLSVDGYVVKPVTKDNLKLKIDAVLKRRLIS
ncbi:CheY-like receiver protein [Candidatus Terasakiella magnetica]|uniref:CheY-like receiver protein n=1 Tax=Candidatus Terasakiella magnetica TaxID=1867952 RepID=A0A1C3RC12_9PROT|nr:response regulator [Candidatus Terasakiella magnetica]SCA54823.1 CheY-like receiver protein [Candidatus Terasakiella magnetica]